MAQRDIQHPRLYRDSKTHLFTPRAQHPHKIWVFRKSLLHAARVCVYIHTHTLIQSSSGLNWLAVKAIRNHGFKKRKEQKWTAGSRARHEWFISRGKWTPCRIKKTLAYYWYADICRMCVWRCSLGNAITFNDPSFHIMSEPSVCCRANYSKMDRDMKVNSEEKRQVSSLTVIHLTTMGKYGH